MHAWSSTWSLVRRGLHAFTAVLLVVLATQAIGADPTRTSLLAASVCTAAVYACGLAPAVSDHRERALWWITALTVAWCWLLWLSPEAVYLAFPLYFLAAHLLANRAAVLAVGFLAVLAVGGYARHEGLSYGAAIGPVLGALVAIATVVGMRAVQRESARRGVLEERERLAREVHDTLAQGLGSINLLLGAAEAQLPVDDAHSPTRELLDEARRVAVDNLAEARRFVRALAPPALDGAPLLDTVASMVRDAPTASLHVSGVPRTLVGSHDVAILRIAREAVTNAVNHAGAERVAVTLTYLDDGVALDVVDNGRGFDPTEPTTGFGLASMRSRATELGGTLEIESAPGAGTAVALALPASLPARAM